MMSMKVPCAFFSFTRCNFLNRLKEDFDDGEAGGNGSEKNEQQKTENEQKQRARQNRTEQNRNKDQVHEQNALLVATSVVVHVVRQLHLLLGQIPATFPPPLLHQTDRMNVV